MEFAENVSLAPYTTFRIGGPARFFARALTEEDLLEGLAFARAEGVPLLPLGGGSNLLIPDAGFAGLALKMDLSGPIEQDGERLAVPAGVEWDALVRMVCEQGRSGMECLAGIPGLVGASPIQNIGAYGQEVAETIRSVRAWDRRDGKFVELGREDCGFGYRESVFNTTQRSRYLITRVTFGLDPGAAPNLRYADLRGYFMGQPGPTPLEVYYAVRGIRQAKGMILLADEAEGVEDTRSAGSFFKNPIVPASALGGVADALGIEEGTIPRYAAANGQVKLAAAWLLERAGFHKAYAMGQAGLSSRHTLAVINRGGATYADVARLRDHIRESVAGRFGIELEQEPVEP